MNSLQCFARTTPGQSAARLDRARRGPDRAARRHITLTLLLVTVLSTGCRAPSKPHPAVAPDVHTDPCAMRLHEVCGVLLLHYATHRDLPASVTALSQAPGGTEVGELICPVSHKPYVYTPAGVPAPDGQSLLVMWDPQPSHAGMRWAVTILPPTEGPLIAKVIAIPEWRFPRQPTTRP